MPPFLRTTPDDVAHLDIDAIDRALAEIGGEHGTVDRMRLWGHKAEWLMANGADGRLAARTALELALDLGDAGAVTTNRIRLATAQFYVGEYRTAESELRSLVAALGSESPGRHLDFALQHLGKCLAEQGRYEEAAELFNRALALRTDPALQASSRSALNLALDRLDRR